jgi:hypothetical protein
MTSGSDFIIPAYPRIYLGLLYAVGGGLGLALMTSEGIKERLSKMGYVQSYTRRPTMEYVFNLAVGYALFRGLQDWPNSTTAAKGSWAVYFYAALCVVWYVAFITHLTIVPVLYFTARKISVVRTEDVMVGR